MFSILGLQSAYSMLNNTIPLKTLIESCQEKGYEAVMLSDDRLHGMVELFRYAKKSKIKPILGLFIHVEYPLFDTTFFVYVKHQQGLKNLMTLARLQAEQKLDEGAFYAHQEGLIVVTGGSSSIIYQAIDQGDLDLAKRTIITYQQRVDDLYLGLSLDTFHDEMKIAPELFNLSEALEIKMLPIHQTSYLTPEDKEVYEALIKIDREDKTMPEDATYHLLSKDELLRRFVEYEYVFDHLKDVIHSIDFTYTPPRFEMPTYPIKEGTSKDYLRSLARVGLQKRLKKNQHADEKTYQERLLHELHVIEKMGYEDYFLIVYDFVKYAKTHDILVGPGRGSAAGSLVAYCLGITDVDPLEFDLLFERFLNPERITMPDIDMDFPDNKRDQVLQYVKEKYGDHHVISIVTFGTFALRSSIRDIARVMKIDNQRVNGIITRVVNDDIDETDAEMMRLLRVAKKIEGLPRHTGTHAAGMILCKQDLFDHIPLQPGINQFYQSQLEASELEALGLLKMDFLGIRNLAVIDDVIKMAVKEGHHIALLDLPRDDQKAFELLTRAETTGIFQLESSGMRAVLRKLKPTTFEDIVAILALYRPGPMDHIDEYIERRNGKPYTYLHPHLESILKPTYGIIVYQEQIMRIAHEFAGYTMAQADLLRRGISKKDKDILETERTRFIEKCAQKGYTEEVAISIYDLIVKFADYGFNRSHSVAYALVAYQMAYLKAHFFAMFMTILLSSVTGNETLTLDYIQELKRHHISVLPPDINLSTDMYLYDQGRILLPLLAIKSIGRSSLQKIMENRELEGPFKDYQDFKRRMKKEINDKNVEMLIHAGALDRFGLNHQTMNEAKRIDQAGYELYIQDFQMKTYAEYTQEQLRQFEKDALGFNLRFHPLSGFEALIQTYQLLTWEELDQQKDGRILAYIVKKKVIKTKQGKPMAFLLLSDGITEREATLFSDAYEKVLDSLEHDVLIFKLKMNAFREQISYVIDRIWTIDQLKKEKTRDKGNA
jgi:DNA polymerase-3 subunit alpha